MSAEAGAIRILAVDDHPVVRQGIAGLVAVHPDRSLVAAASSGREDNRHLCARQIRLINRLRIQAKSCARLGCILLCEDCDEAFALCSLCCVCVWRSERAETRLAAISELGAAKDESVSSAARRVLERSEW